jgi:hypothetical protein
MAQRQRAYRRVWHARPVRELKRIQMAWLQAAYRFSLEDPILSCNRRSVHTSYRRMKHSLRLTRPDEQD